MSFWSNTFLPQVFLVECHFCQKIFFWWIFMSIRPDKDMVKGYICWAAVLTKIGWIFYYFDRTVALPKIRLWVQLDIFSYKSHIKALFTHNIFAHNIEIKRYCNKKIKRHFSSNFFPCVNWKYLFLFIWLDFEM